MAGWHTRRMRTELAGALPPRLADEVEWSGEPVVYVRDGHQDVMLVAASDVTAYRAWMSHRETTESAADRDAQQGVAHARAEYAHSECTTGEEARPPAGPGPSRRFTGGMS
jgi:hypothetical protein